MEQFAKKYLNDMLKISIKILIILTTGLLSASFVFASSTDGTIDSTYKYAWGENIGWINFGCSNCNIHITDSGLSGYALSETIGWIYLSDVDNDAEGNLSGYAWSENAGWIKFNPSNGGVVINSSGEFTGQALGENIGWIIFGGDYKVKTDWRPYSTRPRCGDGTCNNSETCSSCSQDCGGCGGGMPSQWYSSPQAPSGGFKISIDNGDFETSDLSVELSLIRGEDTVKMAISNFSDFRDAGQETFQTEKSWNLCQGKTDCPDGEYAVYAKFYTSWGTDSGVLSDTIIYRKESIKPPSVISKIPKILSPLIPEYLEPEEPETILPPEGSIEEIVPEAAPLVFQGSWNLLPEDPVLKFVLSPLPSEIEVLAQKFPELQKTFENLGITKITDIEKLKNVKLSLSGLTEISGKAPLAELQTKDKEKIPTEIIFAKTGGEKIDINIVLSIDETGKTEQRIETISGKPLQLAIRPEHPVENIKGYVIFKSRKTAETEENFGFSFSKMFASLLSAVGKNNQEEEAETKLVLQEFEYFDSDKDGIYTAEIQAPLSEGEYEILAVMDFENEELGKKEMRLITVVDPEGYVYSQLPQGKMRIESAAVSLFWKNPQENQYEFWPAKDFQQENPQITDDTGRYSFLVPEGEYYLTAAAKNYNEYKSEMFSVKEGGGVHMNIELKAGGWRRFLVFDWKIFVLILFGILLLYNFYRDKIRNKSLN